MGDQEQNEIVGRLIQDYQNAKKQRELIRIDLYAAGRILYDIGAHLKRQDLDEAFRLLDQWNASAKHELRLTIDRANEYRKLSSEIRDYESQLKALGIDLAT